MATEAQILANRANAAHSTGPRTPEGKAASARNATRHGFYSSLESIPDDQLAEFQRLLSHYTDVYGHIAHPDLTRRLEELAHADLRRDRIRAAIHALEEKRLQELLNELDPAGEITVQPHDFALLTALVFERDLQSTKTLSRLLALERQFTRLVHRLQRELATLAAAFPRPLSRPATGNSRNEPNFLPECPPATPAHPEKEPESAPPTAPRTPPEPAIQCPA